MSQEMCCACGAAVGRGDETCPKCGELTALGMHRDAEHRREFESKGAMPVEMMCGVALVCAIVVLLVVALSSGM